MKVIPTINCVHFECVKEKLKAAAKFSSWAQIDIADGTFTPNNTWNAPEDLKKPQIDLEIHLMTENPEKAINDWLETGAKRIIVHIETIKDLKLKTGNFELGLAINPETPVEKLAPYLNNIKFVLILGVEPGLSGQKFNDGVLEKIKFLKTNYPDVIIEVDGGINLETAKLCKEAGANILVSGSYIWESSNSALAFKELENI